MKTIIALNFNNLLLFSKIFFIVLYLSYRSNKINKINIFKNMEILRFCELKYFSNIDYQIVTKITESMNCDAW